MCIFTFSLVVFGVWNNLDLISVLLETGIVNVVGLNAKKLVKSRSKVVLN